MRGRASHQQPRMGSGRVVPQARWPQRPTPHQEESASYSELAFCWAGPYLGTDEGRLSGDAVLSPTADGLVWIRFDGALNERLWYAAIPPSLYGPGHLVTRCWNCRRLTWCIAPEDQTQRLLQRSLPPPASSVRPYC
jgi:hypothetical protein